MSLYLGIDTSNYTTSVAVYDSETGEITQQKKLLPVREGQLGLRQSDAVFHHTAQLHTLFEQLTATADTKKIAAVGASVRPRPVDGSYMPCFTVGENTAKILAAALQTPFFAFSHQEGHIEAVRFGTPLEQEKRFVTFHFSGGTTEAILVDETGEHPTYNIVGGSRDISYGQLLDRIGVALGMGFPSGQEMDEIAMSAEESHIRIPA